MEETLVLQLREELVTGALRPGRRLPYRDLAQRFGVSVTPLRIALRELAAEGLVELRPHTGAWVSPLSAPEVEEIFATRIGIEGWLASRGAPNLDGAALAAMADLVGALGRSEREDDRESYIRASRDLRLRCYGAASRPRLLERFRALFDLSARYHFLTLAEDWRLAQSRAGMERFYEACAARDGLAAEQAVRDALQATLLHVTALMRHDEPGGA